MQYEKNKNQECVCLDDDETIKFAEEYICENNHYMHIECLIIYLGSQLSDLTEMNHNQIMRCPNIEGGFHGLKNYYVESPLYSNIEGGFHGLKNYYVESLLYSNNQEKLVNKLLKVKINEINIFECLNLNCGNVFIPEKLDDNFSSSIVTCMECCSSYCLLCKKISHYNIPCSGENRETFLSLGFMSCPYCYELFAKDDKCNHVKCNKCKNDFASDAQRKEVQ